MPQAQVPIMNDPVFRHNDYRREMQVRILDNLPENNGKMVIEGKAVTFNELTVLFEWDGVEYKEIIEKTAFDECDFRYAYLKYNHSSNIMAMARVKNGSLQIEIREDGVWIKAELSNTTAGRDLYELVRSGIIDKMSFAFTIREESYDKTTHTWTVRKIDKLYDVAAVEVPAYENTTLYARRYGDLEEIRRQEVEAQAQAAKEMREKIRKMIMSKPKLNK